MSERVLPDWDSLPPADNGARTAWGLFGADDSVGLMNLQTPDRIAAAARLVRRGVVFSLDAPLDAFDPPFFGRTLPRRRVRSILDVAFDDAYDELCPQASSQWDALGHVGYRPDAFYNGATFAEVAEGRRHGIETWARRGIAGRAVLLDVARVLADEGRPFDPLSPYRITAEDLETARKRAAVEFSPGDVILLRTGFGAAYGALDAGGRVAFALEPAAAGVEASEPMARYLWNTHASAIASDNPSVEVDEPGKVPPASWPPPNWPWSHLHHVLIGQLGFALGELWHLEDLAADCANDGVYEAFLASAPLHLRGGSGSTANALAIK
ncbi:MAG: cyclase family protein [Gaiellaceae bacterium]